MRFRTVTVCFSLFGTVLIAANASTRDASNDADARRILEQRCVRCHTEKAPSGSLDLATLAGRKRGGKSGQAIVPGKLAESKLFTRLQASGSEPSMPLGDKPLSSVEQKVIQKWIESGAKLGGTLKAKTHWAWIAPQRPKVSSSMSSQTPHMRNPIDSFVQARVLTAGLPISPLADKRTQIRRVTLDLIGLPPTQAEVDAFVNDKSPNAYEKVVDRLLASPHYGERMALPWLDAARYADSNGFQQDGDTFQYVWRDWVVNALNANMPFDQFATEQLAGDLLPNATDAQRVATGFNRNHLLNGEGGAIPEEQRNVNLFDRVNTTATTFLGISLACAQCHDHKYDPFTQKDYYSFMALFNNVPETGVPPGGGQYRIAEPTVTYGTAVEMEKISHLEAQRKSLQTKLNTSVYQAIRTEAPSLVAALRNPLTSVSLSPWQKSPVTIGTSFQDAFERPYPTGLEFLPLNVDVDGKQSVDLPDISNKNNASIYLSRTISNARATAVEFRFGSDDGIRVWLDGELKVSNAVQRGALLGQEAFVSILPPGDHRLVVQIVNGAGPGGFAFELRKPIIAPNHVAILDQAAAGRDLSDSDIQAMQAAVLPMLQAIDFANLRNQVSAIDKEVAALRAALPKVMVMSDAQPRETRILERGEYLQPRDPVTAAVPAVFGSAPIKSRLDFAKWLVRTDNPLTARVQINRYWQLFFGTGLSKTSENFGTLGEVPSHPELLDWLATEFSWDWDVKRIHKLIVMSHTYRQKSDVLPVHLKKDPANRLYARQNRLRVSSLLLRDVALATSGLINRTIGGKPVYPYQPAGIWDGLAITNERDFTYPQSKGADLYRRSLYTFWRRTAAPGNMFDAASRQQCTVNASRTSTPLHALTMMNDITWIEAARVLATNALDWNGSVTSSTDDIGLTILGRPLTLTERKAMQKLVKTSMKYYEAHLKDVDAILSIGSSSSPKHSRTQIAALTQVSLAILNFDEAITRE
ncbi:MAG: PSD1 and planctomycete cytochrome C domain-containing protein [Armatimonadota bacterium]